MTVAVLREAAVRFLCERAERRSALRITSRAEKAPRRSAPPATVSVHPSTRRSAI